MAEIARETLVDGHWVTPHLCGLPFLEKPPLYFDLIALAYGISGRITPAVARTVSFFFGCLMLAAVWLFGRYWRGSRAAWLMVLALVTMPRFWRYSHFIIIDIGVGTLGVSALVCFARAELFSREKQNNRAFICLFLFFSMAAFLTKGVTALSLIVLPVGSFCLLERRWTALRKIFSPLPLLIFFIPVVLWLLLYYREGGFPYLYEHFVNNLIGRFFILSITCPVPSSIIPMSGDPIPGASISGVCRI